MGRWGGKSFHPMLQFSHLCRMLDDQLRVRGGCIGSQKLKEKVINSGVDEW